MSAVNWQKVREKMENVELHVVIADNNVQDRESKRKMMENAGMKVLISTGDGIKALEVIKQNIVDIVVMDMILPGIDGIGILEEVNRMDLKKRPIFIIETALRMDNLIEQAINDGADYYIMKPVSGKMLITRMFQLAQNKHLCSDSMQMENSDTIRFERGRNESRRKKQMKTEYLYSGDLEMDITNILLEIGIPAHIKGYQYIREGIIMSFYDKNMLHYITKCLYPSIAKKFGTTATSVERTMRHAIEVAWKRGDIDTLGEIFGNTVCAGKGKPTNSEFMALITDRLRLEYNKERSVS